MKKGYAKRAIMGCGLGFIITVIGKVLSESIYLKDALIKEYGFSSFTLGLIGSLGSLLWLTGIVLWFYGCYMITKGKGRHGSWAILGVFSLIGLIILLCLGEVKQLSPEKIER